MGRCIHIEIGTGMVGWGKLSSALGLRTFSACVIGLCLSTSSLLAPPCHAEE